MAEIPKQTNAACPVAHESPDNSLIAEAAQQIRHNPAGMDSALGRLGDDLAALRRRRPQILRRQQQVVVTAYAHIAATQLIKRALSLTFDTTPDTIDEPVWFGGMQHTYEEPYNQFLGNLKNRMLAAEADIPELLRDPYINKNVELNEKLGKVPEAAIGEDSTIDNAHAIMRTLVAHRDSYRNDHPGAGPLDIARSAIERAPLIMMMPLHPRPLARDGLPPPRTCTDEEVIGDPFEGLGYDTALAGGRWKQEKLNHPPSRISFCAGIIPLMPSNESEVEAAENFFTQAAELAQHPINRRGGDIRGKFDSATASTVYAATLALRTIFDTSALRH